MRRYGFRCRMDRSGHHRIASRCLEGRCRDPDGESSDPPRRPEEVSVAAPSPRPDRVIMQSGNLPNFFSTSPPDVTTMARVDVEHQHRIRIRQPILLRAYCPPPIGYGIDIVGRVVKTMSQLATLLADRPISGAGGADSGYEGFCSGEPAERLSSDVQPVPRRLRADCQLGQSAIHDLLPRQYSRRLQ